MYQTFDFVTFGNDFKHEFKISYNPIFYQKDCNMNHLDGILTEFSRNFTSFFYANLTFLLNLERG